LWLTHTAASSEDRQIKAFSIGLTFLVKLSFPKKKKRRRRLSLLNLQNKIVMVLIVTFNMNVIFRCNNGTTHFAFFQIKAHRGELCKGKQNKNLEDKIKGNYHSVYNYKIARTFSYCIK
jgi:hypothetical protein